MKFKGFKLVKIYLMSKIKFCFCDNYFSPLNTTFLRKGKDPDPDADLGGPKKADPMDPELCSEGKRGKG
jgi:hypothetical protein